MSDDNKSSDNSSDFLDNIDFDAFNTDESQAGTGEGSFDLDNPFGDDLTPLNKGESTGDLPESAGESSFGFDDSFGDLSQSGDSLTPDSGVSADNPYLSDLADDGIPGGEKKGEKKGFLSGLFGGKGKKEKTKKKTSEKEETEEGGGAEDSNVGESEGVMLDKKKTKKEKVAKEKKPAGERAPLGLGEILCIVFSALWLVCLLVFNIAAFLYSREAGISLMQTLAFMGAINIVGLAAASVPILFYKFPQERTLSNVMLGISATAIFIAVQIAITEFYRYGFIMGGA